MSDYYDVDTGLSVLGKQPSESRLFDFDFTKKMRSADSIASVVSVNVANMGKVVGSSNATAGAGQISGRVVQTRIESGDDGENYKITVKIITTDGDTLEGDGMLYVRDR